MKEINALELRKKFGEVMDEVRYRKEPWIVKKNGRPAMVLVDFELFQAQQESLQEGLFIEDYSQERIDEFMVEDKLDNTTLKASQKSLKS